MSGLPFKQPGLRMRRSSACFLAPVASSLTNGFSIGSFLGPFIDYQGSGYPGITIPQTSRIDFSKPVFAIRRAIYTFTTKRKRPTVQAGLIGSEREQ